MTDITRVDLGWSPFFMSQLDIAELEALTPIRISTVHRDRVTGLSENGTLELTLDPGITTAAVAVGDWVLAAPAQHRLVRVLDRKTELSRGTEYHTGEKQLIAANLDTLFITTSCNNDFNPARLERYLALAHDAMITPVILLTKADATDDPDRFVDQARALGRDLAVLAINAKGLDVTERLSPWCDTGQTVALTGSSGVGKTTIANALTGGSALTRDIREDDARGRHTTTGRSLHHLPTGGWLIDTPGMRGLGVADVAYGIDTTFPEISELAAKCKFRDCDHESEPGCAVQAAIQSGSVDPERLKRFKKLKRENEHATETIAQARDRNRKLGKMYRAATRKKGRD
ncbi:ribosome small subunit-dependent GTPase A [Yoonia sediminilitoris]|uniref:Small ribosomal subunit biogenesis GTPase RsgA n=1 Tax=Yoonia sediminilitoris TaxID=1286148 RepID=A0A2T6K7L6_9RHOB|nr:ribosome small subunit-dependent GTPase A [Yoonia sediminilitoris]PUB10663.1 ribosome biogenesis GTPase [Yoonia sediminilitoris]RCW90415.1 ribosome biogenesis GTPase [Yoonia sediminilitoris]